MPELTLQRVEPGRYTLGELGTLRSGRRSAGEIEADGTSWRVVQERELDWRADQHMAEHFTLRESGDVLARTASQ